MKGQLSRRSARRTGLLAKERKELKKDLIRERESYLPDSSWSLNLHTSSDDRSDEADLATSDNNQALEARWHNRNTLYIKKIDQALERMENGTYGECISCGAQIGYARLKARPPTELCIICKEDQEQREKLSHKQHKSTGRGITAH